ncbi:hypothetical protein MNBD_ACTINO02-1006 [hydrothermal vent metagenome]|uniref:Uncharacterized protein n=1 Tax=hydrothermal vent metagenome TaxID=652676 RepID=A0A3B0SUR1_9ZZZZ
MDALRERFEPVWTSGREHDAVRLLGPDFGLPALPVIEFTQRPELGIALRKLPDVSAFIGDTPTAGLTTILILRMSRGRTIAMRRPCYSRRIALSG